MNWFKTLKIASIANFMERLTHPEEYRDDPEVKQFQEELADIIKRNLVKINEEDLDKSIVNPEEGIFDNPLSFISVIKNTKTKRWKGVIRFLNQKITLCENEPDAIHAFKCCLIKSKGLIPKRVLDCAINPSECEENLFSPSDVY